MSAYYDILNLESADHNIFKIKGLGLGVALDPGLNLQIQLKLFLPLLERHYPEVQLPS